MTEPNEEAGGVTESDQVKPSGGATNRPTLVEIARTHRAMTQGDQPGVKVAKDTVKGRAPATGGGGRGSSRGKAAAVTTGVAADEKGSTA